MQRRYKCSLLSEISQSERPYCLIMTTWQSGNSKMMEKETDTRRGQEKGNGNTLYYMIMPSYIGHGTIQTLGTCDMWL